MIYEWKSIPPIAGISAQAAGEELERIRVVNNGRLEPKLVVDASRAEDAPLHRAFEWDDRRAADAYRLDQASHVIRHIDVVIERSGDPQPVRAFVSVKRDGDRSYTSVQHALTDAELREQVLAQAMRELIQWRQRHRELEELASFFAQVDMFEASSAKAGDELSGYGRLGLR